MNEVASDSSGKEWVPDSGLFEPLYQGSDMSSFDYHTRLIEFTLKHHLTKQGYKDLLVLVARTLPTPNIAVKSEYVMRKYFHGVLCETPKVTGHHYCSNCHHLFDSNDPMLQCPNKCNAKTDRFVLCDLALQLKNMLSGMYHILFLNFSICFLDLDPYVWKAIQSRFNQKRKDGTLSDVYDGEEYKKLSAPGGFLSSEFPANVSFCMNTDGVALFKSSLTEIWPLWLVINELPANMR